MTMPSSARATYDRVGDGEQRRRVDDDEIEPTTGFLQEVIESRRSEQFVYRGGRNAGQDDGERNVVHLTNEIRQLEPLVRERIGEARPAHVSETKLSTDRRTPEVGVDEQHALAFGMCGGQIDRRHGLAVSQSRAADGQHAYVTHGPEPLYLQTQRLVLFGGERRWRAKTDQRVIKS